MFTYIIESQGIYKIGKAKDVEKRLGGYRTHNPLFKLVKTINGDYESKLHEVFESKRSHLEWFKLDEKDVESIDEIIKDLEPRLESIESDVVSIYTYGKEQKHLLVKESNCPCEKKLGINILVLKMMRIPGPYDEVEKLAQESNNYNYEIWADDKLIDMCKTGINSTYAKLTVTGFSK